MPSVSAFQVYGLSFMQEEDARLFVKVMTQVLSIVTTSCDYQNGTFLKKRILRQFFFILQTCMNTFFSLGLPMRLPPWSKDEVSIFAVLL